MAQPRAGRTLVDLEDAVLRRVLLVSIRPGKEEGHVKSVYLEQLAAELMSEGRPAVLSRDLLERLLMERLGFLYDRSEPPFLYLVNCYRRAFSESRKAQTMKDKAALAVIQDALQQVKDLAVSYSVLMLVHVKDNMFPQPLEPSLSPNSLLLVSLLSEGTSNSAYYATSTGVEPLPAGFFDGLLKRFEDEPEGFRTTFEQLYKDLQHVVMKLSPLGPFQRCIRTLHMLVQHPPLAKVLVEHPMWCPKGHHVNGRVLEVSSILGPFFHISVIPDHPVFGSGEPNVRQQCFSEVSSRRAADLMSSYAMIKAVLHQLYRGLYDVLMVLLRTPDTRESALQYLGEVVQKNVNRSQMQSNPFAIASSGMFVSLSAVMLKLCSPFLDASSSKKDKIDIRYVFQGGRIDFSGLTAILTTSEELARWVDSGNRSRTEGFRQVTQLREQVEMHRLQAEEPSTSMTNSSQSSLKSMASAAPDNVKFSFICECFFLTARVLNLGLIKALLDFKSLVQDLSRRKDELATLKNMRGHGAPPGIEQDIAQAEAVVEQLSQDRLCYDSQLLKDVDLLQEALAYYRLMVVWLASLVGGFHMPLPAQCPMDFASMPEHFVEDAMELLLFASRIPKALDGVILDEFMSFIVMFMGSPLHVKNPYLRAKMVEVLNAWMPSKCYSPTLGSSMSSLFEGHQLALQYLVPNLLQLYVDIEFTGAHNQFYDKFNIRHNIAELLEYLWSVPSHHHAWKQVAIKEEKGSYLKFLNLLINDSIFLLDESLKKIPELKEMETQLADPAVWSRRPAQERQERERHYHQQENVVRIDMMLANEDVKMIQYTSEEITAPFLLPEMAERIAAMLNYFLLQLVGPQRKALRLNDPEKYEFRPKELLAQIVTIYVHLDRGDSQGVFARAISSDGRSYRDELFTGAAGVLRSYGGIPMQMLDDFETLGVKSKAQAQEMMDAEALLGDIPEEFLDPIQYTLMTDPVILPSSRTTIDRSVIQRHLLSDQTDPFNRSLLTTDMLIPDHELKKKIDEYLASHSK
ncbi:hypothetical protein M758_7G160400 [Ceratodon purpureus]|uniref:RING-type E3 ubiquitin transferase n=1 Tax=Ceratodon purpureus TaxID=3225 RepID=A0A8T0HDY0_CERPU|nr:hypothetical protein KC19_7G120900 [Ceratodon purpureus]KAG0611717.1 hypothetical protein M758_7G160400 [Ceratodon purpureus]